MGRLTRKGANGRSGVGAAMSVKMSLMPALRGESSFTPRRPCARTISAGNRIIVSWPHGTRGTFHFTVAGLWSISPSATGLTVRGIECDRDSGPSVWRRHADASSLTVAQLIELRSCVHPPAVGVPIVGDPTNQCARTRPTAGAFRSPAGWRIH